MVSARNTRADVVATAGRMFAEKGYHGTSMRDLGKELGLLGSSLYSHIDSKEDLLVEVVEEGARFSRLGGEAQSRGGKCGRPARALIAGHVDVVLDHQDVVRTYPQRGPDARPQLIGPGSSSPAITTRRCSAR
jgi:TetR/AcrR family transcriptional regulator, cholesterol catabolism regulator